MDNKPYSHFDYLTSLFTESPKYFYSDCIAELWAAIPEKVYEENKPFWLIRDNHKKQIEDAIINGELEGIIEERIEGSKDDGFQEITDKNRIRKIEKGRLGNNYVVFTVYHDKFKDWLIKSNQWPLADDCLLKQWFEGEAVEDVGLVSHTGTKTKERELTAWLRETWIKEDRLDGTDFFTKLKKYVNTKGSPITEHYSSGKVAGIKWETSAGTRGEMKKKTIQTKVSDFKRKQ